MMFLTNCGGNDENGRGKVIQEKGRMGTVKHPISHLCYTNGIVNNGHGLLLVMTLLNPRRNKGNAFRMSVEAGR